MTPTAQQVGHDENLVVPGREPPRPRPFLPDPSDMREIAHIAQRWVTLAEIPYRYGPTRRRLRIFPGGWWDSPVPRDHEGERGPRPMTTHNQQETQS